MKRLRVAVLYGGRSGEHEVSLQSAASVINHLDRDRFQPELALLPESVLVVRGDDLVTEDDTLRDTDRVEIRPVMSGGANNALP